MLIYGATGGVGSATARACRSAGRPLHLAGRDPDAVRALAAELDASHTAGDVRDDAHLDQATQDALAAHGAITGLVFAVGSIDLAALKRAERDAFRESFELNLVSGAQALRRAAPALAESGGAAVFFSSVAVAQGFANHTVISSAKGAVEGFVRAAAAEFAPKVRVNAIAPSVLETKIAAPLTGAPKMAEAIAALHALPRLGRAEDAAALAAFLAGPEAGWLTGHVWPVDGGRSRVRAKG